MGLIIKELKVIGQKGEREQQVLFDNGAASSLIKKSIAEELATIIRITTPQKFKLGDGESMITTNEVVNLEIEVNGKVINDQFYVMEKLGKEIILGANTMQKWDIILEPREEKVTVRRDPQAIEFFKFA